MVSTSVNLETKDQGDRALIYPWKAGRTYRFLTEVIPTGNQETTYTSWFGDKKTRMAADCQLSQT